MPVPPNAAVEELLRRLPGLRIDPDGTIYYNGEKIQRLLVDGEDIFAADLTAVTRNFDASKIARIQLLEKKSDRAVFTGIDDGVRTKVINLVMKESAKDGYFGKVEAGGDLENYYSVNGALAGFENKEQFTALGLAANTGALGFSSNTGGSSSQLSILSGGSDALGASAGTGVPRVAGAALHYANTWTGSGDHILGNYQYGQYYSDPNTTSQSFQIQRDSVYGQNQRAISVNRQDQHWFYGTFDWTPNSNSALNVEIEGKYAQGGNKYAAVASSNFNDTLVNSSQRTIQDKTSSQNFEANARYKIDLSRQHERTFSLYIGLNKTDGSTDGYLYSLNRFYQFNGTVQTSDTVDQHEQLADHATNLSGGLSFAEPLWEGTLLALEYNTSIATYNPLQVTYAREGEKYSDFVDSLSSDFRSRIVTQEDRLGLQGKLGRWNYMVENILYGFNCLQRNVVQDSSLALHYLFWLPNVSLRYSLSPQSNLKFNYVTSVQLPTIDQLTQKINNNDPLHIAIGNPDLKPGTIRDFKLGFDEIKSWMIDLTLDIRFVNNSITTRISTDSLGRQVTQPINVNGGASCNFAFSVNKRLLGVDANFHMNDVYTKTVNYVNTALNRNVIYISGGGINLNKYLSGKYSIYLNTNFSYFDQMSSINIATPMHFWTQSHYGGVSIYLVKNYEINTSATYTWQEKTSAFSINTSVLQWNSSLTRNFLHDRLVARFQINNILDVKEGIGRTNINNTYTQTSANIVGRYWMMSLAYHFDRKFKRK